MAGWAQEELQKTAASDDLHIAPLRKDGVSHGTPTWIWSVVVNGALYARAYDERRSGSRPHFARRRAASRPWA